MEQDIIGVQTEQHVRRDGIVINTLVVLRVQVTDGQGTGPPA